MSHFIRLSLLTAFAAAALAACGPTDPPAPECGNGIVEEGEVCDDGNTIGGDGCEAACDATTPTHATCGDGKVEGSEQCDDGNQTPGDGCENDCTKTRQTCGNGVREGTEACDDGNMTPGDGCENDCTLTGFDVEHCADLTPPASGTCEVTPGDANRLLLGTILAPDKVFIGGQVLFDAQGVIQCVGCDCGQSPGADAATKVVCARGIISPGLINPHDHITYQAAPYVPSSDERYEHRHDWRAGKNGHSVVPNGGSSTAADYVGWGELRQLLAGTTSVAGSGGAPGLLRNLDQANNHGLGTDVGYADYDTFPLGDSGGVALSGSCDYPSLIDTNTSQPGEPPQGIWLPHIAEGIKATARNEFLCLTGVGDKSVDVIGSRTAMIHGIGLKASDVARVKTAGAGLIWSPRSNVALYGDTAPIGAYKRFGVPVALGTDWLRSGSMNLLRELKCADHLNRNHFGELLTDEELWEMVTSRPADLLGMGHKIGRLKAGLVADIAIFRGDPASPHRAVIDAEPKDVVLTLRGGKALFGDTAVVLALSNDTCDALDVCANDKSVCLQGDIGKSLAQFEAGYRNARPGDAEYPLFFCGEPADEPTCVPSRSSAWVVDGSNAYAGVPGGSDSDGDGIEDAVDNCPAVFNPIRPLDNGVQSDVDQDGVGDVCDVCPLDPGTTECTGPTPGDADADGVGDENDNCPTDANADQSDVDGDGIGDVCDWCPAPNPDGSACPATIYDIKSGDGLVNHAVSLTGVQVTATGETGYFVQVPASSSVYDGPDHSGLFVYAPSHAVQRGDVLDLTGQVSVYFQQKQLSPTQTTVVSRGHPDPAPVVVAPADVADGGPRAWALEGVLVRVENVTVDANDNTVIPPGGGESAPTWEFTVTSGSGASLRVNDFLHRVTPFPIVGEVFASITGVAQYRNDHHKLEPRSAEDLVAGAPVLADFGPQPAFIREGTTGPTLPAPLTVTLARAQATDTVVTITSPSGDLLVPDGGMITIPAGMLSAVVPLEGVAQNPGVTLTASIGSSSKTATVRVLGASESASLVSVTPDMENIAPGGSVTLTVNLDIPAPAATTVTLSLSPAGFGMLPADVTVLADALSASFTVTADAAAMGSATVTATLGAQSASAVLTVQAGPAGLVINEVDYDQAGTDSEEFVELLNTSPHSISLAGVYLVLVNGANGSDYGMIDLSPVGTLDPGQYLVVGVQTVLNKVPGSEKTLLLTPASNAIQNGDPDAVALYDSSSDSIIDALAYGDGSPGGMVWMKGSASYPVREGGSTATLKDSLSGSLARIPNGADTDDNAADFQVTAAPTPGMTN